MAAYHEFLNPLYTPDTLDLAGIRRSILEALKTELHLFHGTVLDIGSGYAPYRELLLAPPSRATRRRGSRPAGRRPRFTRTDGGARPPGRAATSSARRRS